MMKELIGRGGLLVAGMVMAVGLPGCKVKTDSEQVPAAEGGGKQLDISIRLPSQEKMQDVGRAAVAATTSTGAVLGAGIMDVVSETRKEDKPETTASE